MSEATITTTVAPEIDSARLQPTSTFREEVDLDSMDFLNFVIALHGTLGVYVPERDYGRMSTREGAVEYLAGRLDV